MALKFLNNGYFAGKVGIGTASPNGKLQFSNDAETRKIVLWEGADNDYEFYGFGVETSTLIYSTYSAGDDHVFVVGAGATGRTELMRIKSTGDINIPNGQLTVTHDTNNVAKIIQSATSMSNATYTFEVDSSSHVSNMSAAGAMKVDVNSGRAFTITGAGKVGIGTDNPGYTLDVAEKIRMVAGLKITPTTSLLYSEDGALSYYSTTNGVYLNGAGANGWLRLQASGVENDQNSINIYGSASAYMTFRTSNVTRLTINSAGNAIFTGNVGIGVTNPAAKLEVLSSHHVRSAANSNHKFKIEARDSYYDDSQSAGIWISDGGSTGPFSNEGAQLVIEGRKHTSRNIYFKVGDTTSPQHVMAANGNVGIGTTSPDSKLDVTGGDITVNTSGIGFMNFKYGSVGSESTMGSIQTTGIDLKINATSDLLLLPGSNVGIGTTSPGAKLDVVGKINQTTSSGGTAASFTNSDATSGYGVAIQSEGTSNTRYALILRNLAGSNVYGGVSTMTNQVGFWGVGASPTGTLGSRLTVGGNASIGTSYTGTAAPSNGMIVQGNVGIGTTSPLGRLQVNEYTVASQGNQTDHGELSVFSNSGDESLFLGIKDAAYPNRGWSFNPVTNGVNSNLQFKEHGSTSVRMTIESGGNVGIGVTDPTEKLHLQSTTSGCFVRFADNTASGVYVGSRNDELEIYAGNAERFGINANGVVRFNAYGTGILQTDTNGVISANLSPLVDDIIFNNGASITNQINTDIDSAAAEMVAQVAIATYTAAFFDFVVKKSTNVRSGTVYACHDGTNVEFTETSTQDLGDTSDVVLSVDISGTQMRLIATVASDDWSVKSLIRAI